MKNFVITTMMMFFGINIFAQTTYENTMTEMLKAFKTDQSVDELTSLSNNFQRIAEKEKTQWLPYYYAAFSQIQKGRILMRQDKTEELDAIANTAQKSLDKAIELSPDNAENFILSKMIHSLRMMVNPMERFMSEGKLASQALAKAEKLDPENPRITLLKAEDTYFTPEQFGGNKEKGIELFRKAFQQFKNYKTKTNLDPNWGKDRAEYFINKIVK